MKQDKDSSEKIDDQITEVDSTKKDKVESAPEASPDLIADANDTSLRAKYGFQIDPLAVVILAIMAILIVWVSAGIGRNPVNASSVGVGSEMIQNLQKVYILDSEINTIDVLSSSNPVEAAQVLIPGQEWTFEGINNDIATATINNDTKVQVMSNQYVSSIAFINSSASDNAGFISLDHIDSNSDSALSDTESALWIFGEMNGVLDDMTTYTWEAEYDMEDAKALGIIYNASEDQVNEYRIHVVFNPDGTVNSAQYNLFHGKR